MVRPSKDTVNGRIEVAALPSQDYRFILGVLALITLIVLFAVAPAAFAQERPAMKLSLRQAMELALQKNFNIQIRALDSRSDFANLVGSYGVYDITLSEDLSFNRTSERSITSFRGSKTHGETLRGSISRRIFTGANIDTSLRLGRSGTNSITSSLNPSFNDTLAINFTQPILKNFGKLATERQIMISKNNMSMGDAAFEQQVITTLVDVEKRYWILVSALDFLTVAEDALELAQEQLEINKVKVEVGTLPEIEITAAEERVASREAELVDAQAQLRSAEDNLKQAIVMEDWEVRIEPTDSLQEPTPLSLDFEDSLKSALDKRPELRQLDLQMQNNDISIAFARNQLMPSLNAYASVDLYSYGGSFTPNIFAPEPPPGLPLSFISTLSDVFSATNRNWTIGASFTYILGNSAAKASILNNRIQKRQNQLRLEQAQYDIAVEVRNAIRDLEIRAKQLEARRKALLYAEKQLAAEQQKFQVGSSTNFEVLQYQNQLVSARYNVIVALMMYQNALIDYDRATGALLEKRDVAIETEAEGIIGAKMSN